MAGSFHFCSQAFFSHLAYLFSVFVVVVLLCVFTFLVPCYDVRYDFLIKSKSLPPVVCWRVHVLLCFCVCLCIVVSNILLFLVVLAFCVVLCFFVFVFFPCLVDPMVPISLDCPLLIAPSVFVYFYIFTSNLELKQNGATIFQCVHKPSIYSITAFVYLRHMASQMHIINKINIYSSTNLYQYRDIFPSRTFNTILTFKLHNEFRGTRNIVIPQKLSLVGWSLLWCLTPL